mgnify:CR=1 FL=1
MKIQLQSGIDNDKQQQQSTSNFQKKQSDGIKVKVIHKFLKQTKSHFSRYISKITIKVNIIR